MKANGEGEAASPKPKDDGSGSGEKAASEDAPMPKKKSKVKMEEPEAPSAPVVPSGRAWLDFELGMGGYNRALTFNQNVNRSLLSYTLGTGPIAVANVVMFPFDPLMGGPLGNLGFEAEIQQGFAISSTLSNGNTTTTYKNVVHDYAGGGRYRFTFGRASDFYFSVTGGEDAFTFTGRSAIEPVASPTPSITTFAPASDLHLDLGGELGVRCRAGTAPSSTTAGSQFLQFFPQATVAGADAEVGGRLRRQPTFRGARRGRVAPLLVRHALAAGRHVYPAGGAVDQSFAFTARMAFSSAAGNVPKARGGRRGGAAAAAAPQVHAGHKLVRRRIRRRRLGDEAGASGPSKCGGDDDRHQRPSGGATGRRPPRAP